MSPPCLFIGNKNYSSWSMRPWLALKWAGIAFEERMIPLGGPGYGKSRIAEILAVSDSGRVPALHAGELRIHDSLAIMEWANEQAPEAGLYPRDAGLRALARSAAAEMHAGFAAMRNAMSMNIRRRMKTAPAWSDEVKADLARLFELWGGLRARHANGGPFLFGARRWRRDCAPTPSRRRRRARPIARRSSPMMRFARGRRGRWRSRSGSPPRTSSIREARCGRVVRRGALALRVR
jgi:glutathione S-transferase